MSSMEKNKIFAAVLCAGIVAMLGGFIAEVLVHPHELDEDAVMIEGLEGSVGGGAAVAMPDPIFDLIASADVAKGEKLSKACAACHSFNQGGATKVGPNLYGVVGASKGADAGFSYSAAITAAGGKWGYEDLNFFLWKPKAYIDGTKMNYAGLKKPGDRAAMIAWLRTQGSSLALPSAAEIEAEKLKLAPPEAEATEEAVEGLVDEVPTAATPVVDTPVVEKPAH